MDNVRCSTRTGYYVELLTRKHTYALLACTPVHKLPHVLSRLLGLVYFSSSSLFKSKKIPVIISNGECEEFRIK